MPLPGPVAYHVQFGAFVSEVISTGEDHDAPESSAPDCPDAPSALAHPFPDCRFMVFNEVMARDKPDRTSLLIDHRARVAAGVGTVIPNNLHFAPYGAAIRAAL